MPLTIEQIRAAYRNLPRRTIEVPELGGEVVVRGLTFKEVEEIQRLQASKASSPVGVSRRVVELAAINDDGSPLFVGEDKAIVESLAWAAIDAIASTAMDLSGMSPKADDDAKKG